jgi:hypothetical protein
VTVFSKAHEVALLARDGDLDLPRIKCCRRWGQESKELCRVRRREGQIGLSQSIVVQYAFLATWLQVRELDYCQSLATLHSSMIPTTIPPLKKEEQISLLGKWLLPPWVFRLRPLLRTPHSHSLKPSIAERFQCLRVLESSTNKSLEDNIIAV